MLKKINHINVVVSDLDEAILLGMLVYPTIKVVASNVIFTMFIFAPFSPLTADNVTNLYILLLFFQDG